MSSTYSAASADSVLDLNEPGCEPLRSARSIRLPGASLPSDGLESPVTMTCAPSPPLSCGPMELPWMLSAADSPAKTSPLQGSGRALAEHVRVSGENTRDWLARWDHDTSSWRTAQNCLLSGLETFSETWPRSGTMRNGTAYPRQSLVRPTAEIASGLLPTPRKSRGYTNPTLGKNFGAGCLTTDLLGRPVLMTRPRPQFVEWMMGFPIGWTELAPSATPSSRKSQKSSGEQS